MAIIVASAFGCSKGGGAAANRVGTHQVTGKVTYKGQPVAGGARLLSSESRTRARRL